ncbi:HNH endonuclease family protein [Corynebacterium sp. AOP40-9SA-29]|uniref:HNH endonuclease family protein n=1 Tax=Corynebacterium sp. AOP40-9SA-29 TaxID=3457677 RepID=UPI0040334393
MRLPRPVSSFPPLFLAGALLGASVLVPSGRTQDAPASADRAAVAAALEDLRTVPRRVHVLGYSRDHFGGWSQQYSDGVGCSTRNLVLLDAFADHSPGTTGSCAVATGETTDVYTGEPLTPGDVEIDHVVPLSAAWDHGAWGWERSARVAFANDRDLNLLAVSGAANQAKSDGTLGEWLPQTAKAGSLSGAGCAYAARYLAVSLNYQLTVSAADADTARQVCGL